MELLETVLTYKPEAEEISVHLITSEDDDREYSRQEEYMQQIKESVAPAGIKFSWEYMDPSTIHARHLLLDSGWKILLDRGLDIFQRYDMNDAFKLANRNQNQRAVKAFECTYIRLKEEEVVETFLQNMK
jgi:ATP-dependent Lon protease